MHIIHSAKLFIQTDQKILRHRETQATGFVFVVPETDYTEMHRTDHCVSVYSVE